MICDEINALLRYALEKGLIDPCDEIWARNRLLDILGLPAGEKAGEDLETILKAILDDAAARGLIDGGITSRDLLDTRLMGVLTPRPSAVIGTFRALFDAEAKAATDWYYRFSCDTDYIRRYRIAKDRKWKAATGHDQPLQAGEGSARDRRGEERKARGLSQMPALPGGGGLRRARRLSGAREPPRHPDPARGGGLVSAVFALRLL